MVSNLSTTKNVMTGTFLAILFFILNLISTSQAEDYYG